MTKIRHSGENDGNTYLLGITIIHHFLKQRNPVSPQTMKMIRHFLK
jgi:hypothetical protein